jgi:hypothetical protein
MRPNVGTFQNNLLTRDEARRIAANIAKLPGACCALADPTLPPSTTAEEAARAAGSAMSGWRAAVVRSRCSTALMILCRASQTFLHKRLV